MSQVTSASIFRNRFNLNPVWLTNAPSGGGGGGISMAIGATPSSELAKQLVNLANLLYIVPPQVMYTVMTEGANIASRSAPVLTGNLRANIFAEKLGVTGAAMHSMAPYSGFVNFGHRTRSGSFVPAQPYWTQGQNYVLTNLMPEVIRTLGM